MLAAHKNQRVMARMQDGEQVHGIVISAGKKNLKVRLDNGRVVGGPVQCFSPSDLPIPATALITTSFKVGDRVETTYRGETLFGVVSKVRAGRVTMTCDGAKQQISGEPLLYRYSSKPIAKDEPSEMDAYTVVGYRFYERMSQETNAYDAKIARDGVVFAEASNDGHGGPDFIHVANYTDHDRALLAEFQAACARWNERHTGEAKGFETDALWIDYAANHAPYGVTSAEYLNRYRF